MMLILRRSRDVLVAFLPSPWQSQRLPRTQASSVARPSVVDASCQARSEASSASLSPFRFTLAIACLSLIALPACSRHASNPAAASPPPPAAPPSAPTSGESASPQPPAAAEPAAPQPPATASAQTAPASLDPLEQLVAPIALYPDPLIALVLPASTFPSDLAAAAQYLAGNGDPTQIDSQAWDPSVRGLAHYPTVLEWMAQNPAWTQSLGAAFAGNPADVMAAIQKLRAMAKAAGTLTDTSQQEVVDQDGAIAIEPAQPDMMYVPSYDPDVVYVDGPYYGYAGPYMTFGLGFPVGFWLGYGFDWGHRAFWYGDWRNWRHDGGWGHPVFPGQRGFIGAENAHRWSPPANSARFSASEHANFTRPGPMAGAPRPPDPRGGFRGPAPAVHFDTGPRFEDRPAGREFTPAEHREAVPAHRDGHAPERRREAPRGGERRRDEPRR